VPTCAKRAPRPFKLTPKMVAFVSFILFTHGVSTTGVETFDLDESDRQIVAAIDDDAPEIRIRVGNIDLPPEANRAVRRLLHDLATGRTVHLVPDDAELTTQQAADFLDLSRTFVVRLIDEGKLAAHFAGSHRRLRAADVLAYRERREQKLAGLAELTAGDEALGLTY
jgi:excisionase family DNA binding protein